MGRVSAAAIPTGWLGRFSRLRLETAKALVPPSDTAQPHPLVTPPADCGILYQMKIELTPDQQQHLENASEHPVNVHDPRSKTDYVLVPTEEYEQLREIVEDDIEQRALRRAAARTLAKRLADNEA